MKKILFSALIGTLVVCAASAQPITCPPPPSISDVQSNFEVGAQVSLLSRFLNRLGLNYKQQTAITQNLSQLPNADELFRMLSFMSWKCQSIMAQRVPYEEKIRQWSDVIDQMANFHPTNPIPPRPQGGPSQQRPQSIPPDAFAIEGGRLYKHQNGYSIGMEGNWLVVFVPNKQYTLRLTDDPPSVRFRLADIPQGQWVQLRDGRDPLPIGIYLSNNGLFGQWLR
jgi:hypothetical protein